MANVLEVALDARLGTLAEWVGQAVRVADIGADHGHLALWLLQQHPGRRVLLSDISAASLQKACRLFHGLPERQRALFVVADGLDALSAMPDAEAIVIAGVGAGLIKEMLDRGADRIGTACLCLQPNRDIHFLRAWLQENGFALEAERVVFATGRYYVLLRAARGKPSNYTEKELFIGPLLLTERPPLLLPYLAWQREVLHCALCGLRQGTAPSAREKAEEVARQLRWVEEECS